MAVGDDRSQVIAPDLPKDIAAALKLLRAAGAIPSKPNDIAAQMLDGAAGRRLLVVGLGEKSKVSLQSYREAAAAVAKAARKLEIGDVVLVIDSKLPLGSHEVAAACATGLCLGF